MFRPFSDPFLLWESPVPRRDQKERWDGGGAGVGDDEALQPSRLGLLWAPDSSYQPAAAHLTGCVQRGRVREELRWVLWRGRITAWAMTLTITSLGGSARCCIGVDWASLILECWENVGPQGVMVWSGLVLALGLGLYLFPYHLCYWPSSHVKTTEPEIFLSWVCNTTWASGNIQQDAGSSVYLQCKIIKCS